MRLVLDASVAVRAMRPNEPAHAAAKARIGRILRGDDTIVVPPLFAVEVSASLARQGFREAEILAFVDDLGAQVITMGPKAADAARRVAIETKLRGADAIYAWLARREGLPLCTTDDEIIKRSPCVILAP
jgi:predicted nucleic acid-binding protein